MAVQRTGAATVANMCRRIPPDCLPLVAAAAPQLSTLLQSTVSAPASLCERERERKRRESLCMCVRDFVCVCVCVNVCVNVCVHV